MLDEEDFKKRFKAKLMSLVNDWFFNKERGDKIIQDNYEKYLQSPDGFSPEDMAWIQFKSWSARGEDVTEC